MERNDASLLQGGTAPTNPQAACHRDLPSRSRSHLREHPREVSSRARSARVPFERDFPARRSSGADDLDVGHKHTHEAAHTRLVDEQERTCASERTSKAKERWWEARRGGRWKKRGNQATRKKTDADPNDHGIRTRAKKSAASGVAVDQECVKMFMNLKTRRTYRYIIFKIDEQTGMVKVEKEAGPKVSDRRTSRRDMNTIAPRNVCTDSEPRRIARRPPSKSSKKTYRKPNADTPSSTTRLRTRKDAKRRKSSSSAGRRKSPRSSRKCCTRRPKKSSGGSWTACI